MKKYFLLLWLTFFLFSCGNGGNATQEGLQVYTWEHFSISAPSNWDDITKKDEVLPVPKISTIVLALSSRDLKYNFTNNLLILSQKLSKKTSSLDFSVNNHVWGSRDFLEYTKLDSKNITWSDGDTSEMYIFEAKYHSQTPKLKYIQLWKVCGDEGYLLTLALSTDIKDTSKYEEILQTFQCVNQ